MNFKIVKFLTYLIFLLLSITCAMAQPNVYADSIDSNYYADLIIDIDERGDAVISGTSNHPHLIASYHNLTTKHQEYWIFNLTSDNFSSALFEISLPKHAVITYIKSSAQISIHSDNSPVIKGILKNKALEITVQYYFEDDSNNNSFSTSLLVGFLLFIFGVFILIFYKRKKVDNLKDNTFEKSLTSRQQQIISLLMKKDNVTQSFLEKELGWPKSSLSRNIASLERKGIIIKVNKGNSNVLSLNKKLNNNQIKYK